MPDRTVTWARGTRWLGARNQLVGRLFPGAGLETTGAGRSLRVPWYRCVLFTVGGAATARWGRIMPSHLPGWRLLASGMLAAKQTPVRAEGMPHRQYAVSDFASRRVVEAYERLLRDNA